MMEMQLGTHVAKHATLGEFKTVGLKILMTFPGAVQIRGLLMSSFLKLLFVPVLFALSTYAVDYTDVRTLRSALDPIMIKYTGVIGSQIGTCIQGTSKDPFQVRPYPAHQSMDMCLVYLVKDESLIPSVQAAYKKLNITTNVAVRFQKGSSLVANK